MTTTSHLSRRNFLKLAGVGLGSWILSKRTIPVLGFQDEFPASERLGRVCWGPVDIKTRPSEASQTVKTVYEDEILVWLQEVIGEPRPYHRNRRWVETPEGYIWAPVVQQVANVPNPETGQWAGQNLGEGAWMEVTQPYVNASLVNPTPASHWLRYRADNGLPFRFYYSQVLWVDGLRTGDDGQPYMRVNERYGNPGDIFWVQADAFKPILPEDVAPIHPEAEEKKVVVDLSSQSLSCYEGNREVYYCRVSTGLNPYGIETEKYLTPLGNFPVWGKYISTHMAGGTAIAGWDLPGVGWASIFFQNGQAVHSTYWHNNFGEEMSNGCVNAAPQDARWIFRWLLPSVDYEPGTRTIQGYNGTTMINVIET